MQRWAFPTLIVLLVGLTCGGGYVWLKSRATYYVEDYKPEAIVSRGDIEELQSRFTALDFKHATLHLEWYTYDNRKINRGPYKLRMSLGSQSPDFQHLEIDEIEIESDRGVSYHFAETIQWPIVLKAVGSQPHILEPSFPFQFHQHEIIITKFKIRIHSHQSVEEKTINMKWLPVRVKHLAPLV